ncbi:MAG: hypothetical protein RLO01_01825 [Thalassobaculaceae bacterium]
MPFILIAAGIGAGAALFGYRAGGGASDGLKYAAIGAGLGAGGYIAWRAFK